MKRRFDEGEFFDESMGVVERFGIMAGYQARKRLKLIIGIIAVLMAVAFFSLMVFPRAFVKGVRGKDE